MQERAYSTYCSLKYLSGQGYLSQESQQIGNSLLSLSSLFQSCYLYSLRDW